MICGVCTNTCRTTQLLYVSEKGKLTRKRACSTCVRQSISIFAAESAARCKCGAPAIICGTCVSKKETAAKKGGADVTPIVKRLKAMTISPTNRKAEEVLGSHEWCTADGVLEGLESAIALLQSGRW